MEFLSDFTRYFITGWLSIIVYLLTDKFIDSLIKKQEKKNELEDRIRKLERKF